MSRILAIDAATQACSVALQLGDEVSEQFEVVPKSHAQRLLPMINSLLSDAGATLTSLDCVAFGRGPGSFTGLRIAAGVVQGLAFGADIPVAPVSTLQTIAQGAVGTQDYQGASVVLNAHMAEIYWAHFALGDTEATLLGEERLTSYSEFRCTDVVHGGGEALSWIGLGTGWELSADFPAESVDAMARIHVQCYPHASDMLPFARQQLERQSVVSADLALPVYMREKSAWRKAQ